MTIGQYVGKRIYGIRKSVKMTQEILAKKSGIRQGNISRLEKGTVQDVNVSTLLKLARALGVSLNDLAGDFEEDSS
jgi:transcriptional regulator with XRE-family HTH domain